MAIFSGYVKLQEGNIKQNLHTTQRWWPSVNTVSKEPATLPGVQFPLSQWQVPSMNIFAATGGNQTAIDHIPSHRHHHDIRNIIIYNNI